MINPILSLLVLLATSPQQMPAPAETVSSAAAAPTQGDVDRLQAQVFALRVQLAEAERQLGAEKAQRASYDIKKLEAEAAALPPAVRAILQLPPLAATAPAPALAPATPKQ